MMDERFKALCAHTRSLGLTHSVAHASAESCPVTTPPFRFDSLCKLVVFGRCPGSCSGGSPATEHQHINLNNLNPGANPVGLTLVWVRQIKKVRRYDSPAPRDTPPPPHLGMPSRLQTKKPVMFVCKNILRAPSCVHVF